MHLHAIDPRQDDGGSMSRYTIEHCRRRAEAVQALAAGFAAIARRRLAEDQWRADAYTRLARGEDIVK